MINIMYLVLIVLFVLNVLVEVMNVFFMLDEGNIESINIVDVQFEVIVKGVKELFKEFVKCKFQVIGLVIDDVCSIVVDFNKYVDDLCNELIDKFGDGNGSVDVGDFKEGYEGEFKYIRGKKNKDVII